jgi:hypothetical protein
MRNLLKLCLVSILFVIVQNCYAQKADSTKQSLYIIDGKPASDTEFNKLKATDIFEVSILNDSTAAALNDRSYPNGTMLITTKTGAKKLYQQKFSAFSKKYKAYIDAKGGDDSKLLYVINDTMLIAGANKSLRKLSDLKPEEIKEVAFKKDSRYVTDATVVITTKEAGE